MLGLVNEAAIVSTAITVIAIFRTLIGREIMALP